MCKHDVSSGRNRYNRLFQKVTQKGGESAINYVKRFHDYKALVILVGNSCSEDHLIITFLESFLQGVNYSVQIAIHQAELRREETFFDKNNYIYLTFKLIV